MESNVIEKTACPGCPSSDAFVLYDDGHGYCFSCGHRESATGDQSAPKKPAKKAKGLISGTIKDLASRGINRKTCGKWDYQCGEYQGQAVQIASYKDNSGNTVAQKVRFKDKTFVILGDAKKMTLYGQHLWPDNMKKMLVITEGEIDALSVSQAQGNKWPVVSVPNGANGAAKAIKDNLEWVESFDEVIFMFDMDTPGRQAADECAALLTPGKAKIASLAMKDANELLQAGKTDEIISAIFGAKEFRPDGIVAGIDLLEQVLNPKNMQGIPYPWACINEVTKGLRLQELVTICAGSGIGKSTMVREVAYHLLMNREKVGYVALEESVQKTALSIMGLHTNQILHFGTSTLNQNGLTEAFYQSVGNGRFYLYDHFGSTGSDNLLNKLRYMARGMDCKWIILDHLSILVSGIDDGDERRLIDNTMTALRSLVQELNIGLILVSHLSDPGGKVGHEEGAAVTLRQLRGSRAIGQLSDIVIGLERNQQSDDPNMTSVRVVKNRPIGICGLVGNLRYVQETGRLVEASDYVDTTTEESDY